MEAMTAVGVIPARFGSSRFPGKPLVEIAGRPMIQRVWEGARRAKSLRELLVATDDERIAATCRDFGARVVLTRADHPTGTDRIAEAAASLDDELGVNVQGDEPTIEGFGVDSAEEALAADREFLTQGGVFTNDLIDGYIDLKMEEVTRLRMTTHPVEFDLYYSL